jgi:membrane-associated phospholipid phosphatase
LVVLLVLLVSSTACASATRHAKLAGSDVLAVAKAPAREWKKVAATTAIVRATLLVDDEVMDVVRRNDAHVLDQFTKTFEPFGGGHSDKVMAAFLLYGLSAKNERARNVAFDAFVSSVIASKAITPALKQLLPRERPHGASDNQSFPSNHATQAFAVASVIAAHHPHRRWVRGLAYSVAGGVGFARIYHDDHYPSDVLAGAAIGMLVGHTVARTNQQERLRWNVAATRNGVLVSIAW